MNSRLPCEVLAFWRLNDPPGRYRGRSLAAMIDIKAIALRLVTARYSMASCDKISRLNLRTGKFGILELLSSGSPKATLWRA